MTQSVPELRQVVLLTSDLEGSLAGLRSALGTPPGFRDTEGMAAIGFNHEIVGFERTYVEVCEPRDPGSPLGQKTAEKGDSGFMVVVQVPDGGALRARAARRGLSPIVDKEHHGNQLSQWHPRDFGTLAEFDEIRPSTSWHFAPAVYNARSTSVVNDIAAVWISVAAPTAMAERWAEVTGGILNGDGTSVDLGGRAVNFDNRAEQRGLHTVECLASDRGRVGDQNRICGVDFLLV